MAGRIEIAYVLAGGRSSRIGTDKLSLIIDGVTLLEHTTTKCAAVLDQVKLVAPKVGKLSELSFPVVLDSPSAAGPMAGVIAAVEDCRAESCFVTAADLFDLRAEVIALLVSQYRGQQYFGLMEPLGIQPLCGIYHKSALTVLYARANQGRFGMTDAVRQMDTDSIVLPQDQWRNINTPEDLASVRDYDA
ncbi:MAG: molybdenum cofactor guanylyltransferase [candidate division Zixibacteria bacterium]|nr:molybdenum cofactor guanylyltransferase [candidate division Zixibacteria bacterium]